ncbi:hypothetical protein ABIA94_008735 [Bradyrhizobium sp. LA7.1]
MVIDVRYLPHERKLETEAMIEKMTGNTPPAIAKTETQHGEMPS